MMKKVNDQVTRHMMKKVPRIESGLLGKSESRLMEDSIEKRQL